MHFTSNNQKGNLDLQNMPPPYCHDAVTCFTKFLCFPFCRFFNFLCLNEFKFFRNSNLFRSSPHSYPTMPLALLHAWTYYIFILFSLLFSLLLLLLIFLHLISLFSYSFFYHLCNNNNNNNNSFIYAERTATFKLSRQAYRHCCMPQCASAYIFFFAFFCLFFCLKTHFFMFFHVFKCIEKY